MGIWEIRFGSFSWSIAHLEGFNGTENDWIQSNGDKIITTARVQAVWCMTGCLRAVWFNSLGETHYIFYTLSAIDYDQVINQRGADTDWLQCSHLNYSGDIRNVVVIRTLLHHYWSGISQFIVLRWISGERQRYSTEEELICAAGWSFQKAVLMSVFLVASLHSVDLKPSDTFYLRTSMFRQDVLSCFPTGKSWAVLSLCLLLAN